MKGWEQKAFTTASTYGRLQDISIWTGWLFLSSALTLSASLLNMRKEGIEISLPDPSSAMMGSVLSQVVLPESRMHSVSSQRQVSSAIITPAAPALCAFRTYGKEDEKNESEEGRRGSAHSRFRSGDS